MNLAMLYFVAACQEVRDFLGRGNQRETSLIKNKPKVNLQEHYSEYSYKWFYILLYYS